MEISVTTDGEAAEAVVELFNRYGQGGAVVEMQLDCLEHELTTALPQRVVVKSYLPGDGSADDRRQRLEEGLWHLSQIYPIPDPVLRPLAEQDWMESWKKQYHLQRIGRRIVIVPAWEEYAPAPGEAILRLEPGMAFGTGLHPTTRLCLQALETRLIAGSTVLDVGTGSGVLAIAAAKLGARSILALDADPTAVAVAQENVRLNKVAEQVTVQHGTLPGGAAAEWLPPPSAAGCRLSLLETGRFDLILINILAPVIAGMAPALAARLAEGGQVIASGIIDSQEADVAQTLGAQGLQVVGRAVEKDWVSLVARRR